MIVYYALCPPGTNVKILWPSPSSKLPTPGLVVQCLATGTLRHTLTARNDPGMEQEALIHADTLPHLTVRLRPRFGRLSLSCPEQDSRRASG